LQEHGAELEEHRLDRKWTPAELDELVGDRDYRLFLNQRNELYRERNMGEKPPSREEALRLMSENPNLIRRPIAVKGKQFVFGYDEKKYTDLVG